MMTVNKSILLTSILVIVGLPAVTRADLPMWTCIDGAEIDLDWKCDGQIDCNDGSDESPLTCVPQDCKANEFMCTNKKCISLALRCNGEANCGEGDVSDEHNCSEEYDYEEEKVECNNQTHFLCQEENICIEISWVCDGSSDCLNDEDERDCPCKSDKQFRCNSTGNCIDEVFRCDGERDCKNGEDERNCPTYSPVYSTDKSCDMLSFACDGTCFPSIKACDGFQDCLNGEDEGEICQSDQCMVRSDVREKAVPGQLICDHSCRPTPSGPRCFCFSGFGLEKDGFSCKIIGDQKPFLYFAADNEILRQSLSGWSQENLIYTTNSTSSRITTIQADVRRGKLFWLDEFNKSLVSRDSQGNIDVFMKMGRSHWAPTSFAYDWDMNNIYILMADYFKNRGVLKVFKYRPGRKPTFFDINTNLHRPMAIALSPPKRVAIVIDNDHAKNKYNVLLLGMDGSFVNPHPIFSTTDEITGLTVDQLNHHVYWTQTTTLGKIKFWVFDLNDLESKPFVRSMVHRLPHVKRLTSLAVFNKDVFFSDALTRQIWRVDSITGKSMTPKHETGAFIRMQGEKKLGALFVSHTVMQPQSPHNDGPYKDCSEVVHCSHICLPNPGGVSCSCPVGMKLAADRETCENYTPKKTKARTAATPETKRTRPTRAPTTSKTITTTKTTTEHSQIKPKQVTGCTLRENDLKLSAVVRLGVYGRGEEITITCEKGSFMNATSGVDSAVFTCNSDGVWKGDYEFGCAPFRCTSSENTCGVGGICETNNKLGSASSVCLCGNEKVVGPCHRSANEMNRRPTTSNTSLIVGVIVAILIVAIGAMVLVFKQCRPKLNSSVPWRRLYDPDQDPSPVRDGKQMTNTTAREYEMRSSPTHDVKFSEQCNALYKSSSHDTYYFKDLNVNNDIGEEAADDTDCDREGEEEKKKSIRQSCYVER